MTKRKEAGLGTHAFGEASVLAIASELILRGFVPLKPFVDDHGVDIWLARKNKACRLQVKAASLGERKRSDRENQGSPRYEFTFVKVRSNYNDGITSTPKVFSEETDFVILHCVEDDLFFVVPSELLDNRKTFALNFTNPKSKELDMDSMHKDRESGMTFKEIGAKYGISGPAAYERLNGKSGPANDDLTRTVLKLQDGWDQLSDFLNN